jgi:hypothetical protein
MGEERGGAIYGVAWKEELKWHAIGGAKKGVS